jgi:hypothetical protein
MPEPAFKLTTRPPISAISVRVSIPLAEVSVVVPLGFAIAPSTRMKPSEFTDTLPSL